MVSFATLALLFADNFPNKTNALALVRLRRPPCADCCCKVACRVGHQRLTGVRRPAMQKQAQHCLAQEAPGLAGADAASGYQSQQRLCRVQARRHEATQQQQQLDQRLAMQHLQVRVTELSPPLQRRSPTAHLSKPLIVTCVLLATCSRQSTVNTVLTSSTGANEKPAACVGRLLLCRLGSGNLLRGSRALCMLKGFAAHL